jgi:hypothetical protein
MYNVGLSILTTSPHPELQTTIMENSVLPAPPPPLVTLDTTDTIDDAIVELDAAIEALSKRRQELLQRRNALSLIGRLFPELIAEIFELAATEPLAFYKASVYPRWKTLVPHVANVRSVLTFSHVSRQFRGIALSTPTLWSAPPFSTHKGLTNLALQRSAGASLSIALRPTPHGFMERDVQFSNSNMLENLATTRDLWLPPGSWPNWMNALPTATGLRNFCAQLQNTRLFPIDRLNTEHLTTLALAGTGVHLSPLGSSEAVFPWLQRLDLCLTQPLQSDRTLVLRILERAVSLTEFALRLDYSSRMIHLSPEDSSPPSDLDTPPLVRPGIRDIELLGPILFNVALLRQLRLSATCAVRLSSPDGALTIGPQESRALLECIAQHLAGAGCRPRHLTVEAVPPYMVDTLFRWTPDGAAAEAGTGSLCFGLLEMASMRSGVNWTSLTSLHLDVQPRDYEALFREGRGLHHILLDAQVDTLVICVNLCEHVFADRHALRPDTSPPFPRLRLLRLIFPETENTKPAQCESVPTWSTSVHQLLARRTADGYPLETLVVETWGDFRSTLQISSTSASLVQYVSMI